MHLHKLKHSLWLFALIAGDAYAQSTPYVAPPANIGRYCSKTFSNGTHDLTWGSSASDPCSATAGGTIVHAGLYDRTGPNRVYVTCSNGAAATVDDRTQNGDLNLVTAEALAGANPSCRYLVAPISMPVFRAPWGNSHSPNMIAGNGVDFAFDTTGGSFGYPRSTIGCSPNIGNTAHVDFQGTMLPGNGNHSGYDWWKEIGGVLQHDWGVRAVAAGKVLISRARPAFAGEPACATGQNEVYIEHKIGWDGTPYYERFISYYAHMANLEVSAGDVIVQNELLGVAGATGCVSPAGFTHLHMSVYRLRNVKGALSLLAPNFDDGHSLSDESRMVDPFGWSGCSADPWATLAPANQGAPSVDLWITNGAIVPPPN